MKFQTMSGAPTTTCCHCSAYQTSLATLFVVQQALGTQAVCMSTMETYFHDYADTVQPAVMSKPLQDGLCDPQFDNAPLAVLLQHCETVKDIAAVSKVQANIISSHTKQQHKSSAWYGVRAGRVTASAMHAVVVCNIEKPAVSPVRKVCYPTALLTTQDTRWGIEHEETARSVYQAKQAPHHIDLKIELSGFCINPEFPQVGATPNGLLHCICCGKDCLEIKCPAKHKNNTVQEACDGDRDFCLQLVNNTYQLKQGHRYYTQVQTQIFKDLVVVRVMLNVRFWESCLQKAQEFFLKVSLPELICQITNGGLAKIGKLEVHDLV
uniref:YqaJ viral recombinase domain-containing protein n=1 Tax=Fundulus heteroclitus TaxID=8078 RepID=A0A3Q2NRW6_FUNHE